MQKEIGFASAIASIDSSATACNVSFNRGTGDLITETREVSNFDSISLSGSG